LTRALREGFFSVFVGDVMCLSPVFVAINVATLSIVGHQHCKLLTPDLYKRKYAAIACCEYSISTGKDCAHPGDRFACSPLVGVPPATEKRSNRPPIAGDGIPFFDQGTVSLARGRWYSATMPLRFVPPCLPMKAAEPPSGAAWLHEIKHDGFRLMVRRDMSGVRLLDPALPRCRALTCYTPRCLALGESP
jgi:hypothetical protein